MTGMRVPNVELHKLILLFFRFTRNNVQPGILSNYLTHRTSIIYRLRYHLNNKDSAVLLIEHDFIILIIQTIHYQPSSNLAFNSIYGTDSLSNRAAVKKITARSKAKWLTPSAIMHNRIISYSRLFIIDDIIPADNYSPNNLDAFHSEN